MPASKAQQKAVAKYMKENYDVYQMRMPKGKKDIIRAHAEAHGESLNGFVNRAIDETIERDGDSADDDSDNHKMLAWDPDFTKVTPKERCELEEAEADPELVDMNDIDWD